MLRNTTMLAASINAAVLIVLMKTTRILVVIPMLIVIRLLLLFMPPTHDWGLHQLQRSETMSALETHICPTIVDIKGIQSINWSSIKWAQNHWGTFSKKLANKPRKSSETTTSCSRLKHGHQPQKEVTIEAHVLWHASLFLFILL